MPNIQVKLRRGTATEHNTFTGAEGEVTVDTTNDTLRVHDGSTAGGVRLAKLSEVSGGTGTVTSVGSGTGLTGGPITTSGTLSLASIANLRALGNVSGSTAAPTAVEIKDEDAMTSNSATALATQQSIKAYVDSQTVSKFDSGWVNQDNQGSPTTVDNNVLLTFSHGRSTDELVFYFQVADDSSGTNARSVLEHQSDDNSGNMLGAQIQEITSSTVKIRLGQSYQSLSSGSYTGVSFTGKYVRLTAIG
jgi:hypothetical protein